MLKKKSFSDWDSERNQQIHRTSDGEMVDPGILDQKDSVGLPTDAFVQETWWHCQNHHTAAKVVF